MFSLPFPFKEKGALKTWNFNEGYVLDCNCLTIPVKIVEGDFNISGINVELSNVEGLLGDILAEAQTSNAPVTQTSFITTGDGIIPASVESYSIYNLGINPNNPLTTYNAMIINGISIDQKLLSYSNSSHSAISNSITYQPNGNTLLIIYNA